MKYVVILCDGMADMPDEHGQTPMSLAKKPTMDKLAQVSECGICATVPQGMSPGSDTANLSVMGYDPALCYTGRSPLEAVSMGIKLKESDITYRLNLVTLSDEKRFEDKRMLDYSAGEIDTAAAKKLIELLKPLAPVGVELFGGISYRHCFLRHEGKTGAHLTPPHDITLKKIGPHLPSGEYCSEILEFMKKTNDFLTKSPLNNTKANCAWLWGEGTKPRLEPFEKRFGIKGAVISAVDLIKGIGICADMHSIDVDGATGTLHTNFDGKATAAINALSEVDYVYIHLEAPDECGHQGDKNGKIRSIELIDEKIVAPVFSYLEKSSGEFKILIIPDHATPLALRTHTSTPVPYLLYDSHTKKSGISTFTESASQSKNILFKSGESLARHMLKK